MSLGCIGDFGGERLPEVARFAGGEGVSSNSISAPSAIGAVSRSTVMHDGDLDRGVVTVAPRAITRPLSGPAATSPMLFVSFWFCMIVKARRQSIETSNHDTLEALNSW